MSTYHRWKYYTVRICAYQNTSPSSITNLGHDNQHIDRWKKMHILEYFAANCYCGVLGRVSYHIKNVSSAKLGVRKYKIHLKLILHIENTNRNVLSCLTLNWELGCSTSITFGSIRYIELLRHVHLYQKGPKKKVWNFALDF